MDADVEPLQTNPDLEEGYCKALLCRLRFRKVLACVCCFLKAVVFKFLHFSEEKAHCQILAKIKTLADYESLVVSCLFSA